MQTRCGHAEEYVSNLCSGEASQHDKEMADAVIEVMAEANDRMEVTKINPFRAHHGEILPENVERNFSGFLVRTNALMFIVVSQKLQARIAMLRYQLVIVKFVGPKPSPQAIGLWLQTLNHELRGSQLSFLIDYNNLPVTCRSCHN